jgi:5'-nucleotidase
MSIPIASLRTLLVIVALLLVPLAPPRAAQPLDGVAQSPAQTYRILITNDDGVRAPGILAVAQALKAVGDVTIVAPAGNQSGKGHSITIEDPIYVDSITLPGDLPAISVTGTPATSVKVALGALLDRKPDLVVSGINRGWNLGAVAYVSGTVGAAREAALAGLPAIAASLAADETNYAPAAQVVRQVVEVARKVGMERGVFLNVNIPAGPPTAIKGIQLTRQSTLTGVERFEEQRSPRGRRYFWSVWNEPTGDAEGTDVWAIEHGYAAVTPLQATEFDAAAYEKFRGAIGRQK